MSDEPIKVCPKCKKKKVERLISLTSFHLKGGGWYSDLYGSSKGGAKSESKSESSTTSETKAETKTEAKADKPAKAEKVKKASST